MANEGNSEQRKAKIARPVYKKKKYAQEQGRHRAMEILRCKKGCRGNPEPVSFSLHEGRITGERCKECLEVINYKVNE